MSGPIYSGRQKTQAKRITTPHKTAMRGVFAPEASASARNSHTARAATAAAASVINQNGPLNTSNKTTGIKTTAVRTRFIVFVLDPVGQNTRSLLPAASNNRQEASK